jgi:hypothetical protein
MGSIEVVDVESEEAAAAWAPTHPWLRQPAIYPSAELPTNTAARVSAAKPIGVLTELIMLEGQMLDRRPGVPLSNRVQK